MNTTAKKFDTLDTLRGIAALAVAVFHFNDFGGGYLAADFFFVLSGFVLAHSYLYKYDPIPKRKFIVHRLARLYPLQVFTLITFIATFWITNGIFPTQPDGTTFTLIQNIALIQNIGLNPSELTYNYPSWSISVEFWVNIIFVFLIHRSTNSIILTIIAVLCLVTIYFLSGSLDTNFDNYYNFFNSGLLRGLSSFLLGIVAYRIYLFKAYSQSLGKTWVEILVFFAIYVIIVARSEENESIDFLAPLVFMVAVIAFSYESGYFGKLLSNANYLGKISYSVYLNQVTVMMALDYPFYYFGTGEGVISITIYLCVLLIYSHFTYKYLELPMRHMIRKRLAA